MSLAETFETEIRADAIMGYAESAIVLQGSVAIHFFDNIPFGQEESRASQYVDLDNPLKLHEYIPYSALNEKKVEVEGDYASRLGMDMRRSHDNRTIGFIATCARGKTIRWRPRTNWLWTQLERRFPNWVAKRRKLAASRVLLGLAKSKGGGLNVILHPGLFFDMLETPFLQVSDFDITKDERGCVSRVNFGDITIAPACSVFGLGRKEPKYHLLDGAAKKYLGKRWSGHRRTWGVVYPEDAIREGHAGGLAVHVSDDPDNKALLVRVRQHYGTALSSKNIARQIRRIGS